MKICRFGVKCGGSGTVSVVLPGAVAKVIHLVHLGLPLVMKHLFSVYPLANEMVAFVSVICHNKKIVFEKFRTSS